MANDPAYPGAAPPDEQIGQLIQRMEKGKRKWFSFEFYPPKTQVAVEHLYERLQKMAEYRPLFCDFTFGAGGSTQDLTFELTTQAKERYRITANMHLTCTNMPKERVEEALRNCHNAGITNILALRGDPPAGQEKWEAVEGGFTSALSLVSYIKKQYKDFFSIGVAGYPEGHPNVIKQVESFEELSPSEQRRCSLERNADGSFKGYYVCKDEDFEKDIAYLKSKVDAGADFVITQMFFCTDMYEDFVEACRRAGITVPIIPGIMCINTVAGFKRMTAFCHTRVPRDLWEQVCALDAKDEEAVRAFGIHFGIDMCRKLLDFGVPGIHLYCLNLAKVALGIVDGLGLAPAFLQQQRQTPAKTVPVGVKEKLRKNESMPTTDDETELELVAVA